MTPELGGSCRLSPSGPLPRRQVCACCSGIFLGTGFVSHLFPSGQQRHLRAGRTQRGEADGFTVLSDGDGKVWGAHTAARAMQGQSAGEGTALSISAVGAHISSFGDIALGMAQSQTPRLSPSPAALHFQLPRAQWVAVCSSEVNFKKDGAKATSSVSNCSTSPPLHLLTESMLQDLQT